MSTIETPATAAAPASRRAWRLSPATRKTVTVVHVIASVALLGEVWGLVVLNLTATLTDEPALAGAAYRLMERLVFGGGIPLSMLALCSGLLLALASPWGLVRHYWVFTKLILLIAVIGVGMFVFDPASMAAGAADGTVSSGSQWGQVAAVSTQALLLITATTLSIFKPRGRMRRVRSHQGESTRA
ncbi:hypothetical protein [Spirillospora sp. CA-294931]|uniref:hypothetical protein n=1 Tax=Spirillospora sp. CA-294931 TaxID=3240042 RepID=UPI003D8C6D4A